MTSDAKTQELLKLERQFWDAMRRKDGETAARLTANESVAVGAQGVSLIPRETMAKLTMEGQWTLEDYEFDEKNMQIRNVTDDVAVVAYNVKERLMVEGKELTLEANDASVWVRQDGEWRCALHTESPAGDPFGRDKAK
jgi:uncharacterized protein (TIGR02246 family)